MYYRYLFCIITAFVLLASGCTETVDHKGKTPLVQVGDNYLYMEDVMAVTPPGISEKDSAEMADRYIKNLIYDMLLYAKAEGNIPDDAGINELVNSYRRELITHTYIEQIVSQEVENLIPDSEVEEYYNENKDAFLAVEPYIKGLYIKVPKTASGISQVRQWYRDGSERSVDKIEKYGLRNAVDYEYFYDRWRSVNDFFLRLPTDADKEKNNIGKNKNIELSDSAFYYFLHIEDYLGKGEILPLEYAGKDIREIIMNNKRVEFITKMKKDLYDEACDNNDIKYFNASNE